MWPWELKQTELNNLDNWFYIWPHLFIVLYNLYKVSFLGVGIQMGPNTLSYYKGWLVNFLNLPVHLEVQILGKVWKDGEHFDEIVIS